MYIKVKYIFKNQSRFLNVLSSYFMYYVFVGNNKMHLLSTKIC